MTIGELIQRVQSLYSKGVQSDDTRLKRRHIYNKLITSRNDLLLQLLLKGVKIGSNNYQLLPCLELTEVSSSNCSCVETECTLKRTKNKLPRLLESNSSLIISEVSSVDGEVIFSQLFKLKHLKGNRYTSKDPFYYLKDNYLYIENVKGIDYISIVGLFENPVDVYSQESYCEEESDCISILDREFPIDGSLIETIMKTVVNELIGIFPKENEDTTNDTTDNNSNQNE